MSNQVLSIPKLCDKSLIECFTKVAQLVSDKSISSHLRFFGNSKDIIFYPFDIEKSEHNVVNLLKSANSTLIENIFFHISSPVNQGGLTLYFWRGGQEHSNKSPFYDQIIFKDEDSYPDFIESTTKLQIAEIVIKDLHAFSPDRAISTSPEQNKLQALHEATLDRLEQLNENLIQTTAQYRVDLDQQHSAKRDELEAELVARKKDLYNELELKEQELQRKTEELEKQRKELDDNNNTHARRQLRQDILKEIKARQESFKLTNGTNALRKPIMLGIGFLIIVFMVLAVFSVSEFKDVLAGDDFNKIILLSIKQAIYTAGAIGSILYLIKWQNRWFEQHATAEFHLKKLELDIERASWVVETTLEWKDTKGTEIPTELLASLTKNLFNEAKEVSTPLVHPADQLASALLGSSSSIKLKVGDAAEFQIDPKKLSKSDPIEE